MKTRSSFSVLIFFVIIAIGLAIAYSGNKNLAGPGTLVTGVITLLACHYYFSRHQDSRPVGKSCCPAIGKLSVA